VENFLMAKLETRALRACLGILVAWALAMPSAKAQQQQPLLGDYALNPGDQLEVSVWKEPDLTKTVVVRPDGKISFPLTGEVTAVGRTVAQVQTEIASKLKTYIPEPVVTVTMTALEGNRVYVIGQVNKPGAYVMNPRLNVLQALSVAGGMTAFASGNEIIVLRKAGTQQRVLPFRYGDVSKGRTIEQNVALEAGDVIVVP
jgi:polysaccharide export outer membrane protein